MTTSWAQSGRVSNKDEDVLHTPQSLRIGALLPDAV